MSKIRFHPFFVLYVFICIYCGWFNEIFYYVVSVVLHEYGHYIVAKLLGYESQGIVFNVYGAGLQSNNSFKRKDEILISIAGPCVNLILIILTICLWWIFPITYSYSSEFLKSNFVVMLFNLIPIYPLDGGRIIVCLLSARFRRNNILKWNNFVGVVVGMMFCAMFVVSLYFSANINLLIIGMFVTINSIIRDKNKNYNIVESFVKKYKNGNEVKIFKVESFDKVKLLRYVSPHYYSVFLKINSKEKKIICEDDLLG